MSPFSPKRILMTADTVGGVWCYALELAGALQAFGVEVLLATMGPLPSREQRQQLKRLPNIQLAESSFKLEWMEDPWRDVEAAGEWLLRLAAEFEPDVVHLNGYVHGGLGWKAPVVIVGHSCVLSWWRAVHGGEAPDEWHTYRTRVEEGLMGADLVLAPSRAMAAALEEHYGLPFRTKVIPNGRRLERFSPRAKEQIIFCAGRLWDEAKNVGTVCTVARELPWPVVLAGDCMAPGGRKIQLPNVRCLGKVAGDDIPAWFGRAAIYAHPARYEPFGLSVLEAAASGCALVLGDIPSLRENWDEAALFVNPGDCRQIRNAIQRLIEDPGLRGRISEKARMKAQSYSIRTAAELYHEAYSSLLRQHQHNHSWALTA